MKSSKTNMPTWSWYQEPSLSMAENSRSLMVSPLLLHFPNQRESGLSGRVAIAVQSLSHVQLFATPWTAACQTISRNLLKLMSIELVMLSNRLILCHPLLLLPSVFPSIRIFFNESDLRNRPNIGASALASVLPLITQG